VINTEQFTDKNVENNVITLRLECGVSKFKEEEEGDMEKQLVPKTLKQKKANIFYCSSVTSLVILSCALTFQHRYLNTAVACGNIF
jgi:hypothetical protein